MTVRALRDDAARLARHWGLLVICALALCAGLMGLDLGRHWDEHVPRQRVLRAMRQGELLPDYYDHPSLTFDLSLLSAAPEIAHLVLLPDLRGDDPDLDALKEFMMGEPYKLRTRAVFLALSLLAIVWTYLLALTWKDSRVEATLAAALVGFSWEYGYHARWIAPDALMASFTILSLLAIQLALRHSPRRWLAVAALAAGIACSAKYPAGVIVAPLAWAALAAVGGGGRVRSFLRTMALFAVGFLLTTPGALLQYRQLLIALRFQLDHYGSVGHGGGHLIERGLPHLAAIFEYLGCAALSWHPALSLAWALVALPAIVIGVRSRAMQVFLLFPLLYVALMGCQTVFFARNLMVLIPILAVLSARGAALLQALLERRRGFPRWLLPTILSAALVYQAGWLTSAAWSVKGNHPAVAHLQRSLTAHPAQRFGCSAGVRQELHAGGPNAAGVGFAPLPCVNDPDVPYLIFGRELAAAGGMVAHRHDTVRDWFGPREMNYNYYPSWLGRDRIIILPPAHARQRGLVASP
jgi:hypothetical protein